MASFTFNTPQHHQHLFPRTLCKCPSSLYLFNFHSFSHFFTFSPPKHPLLIVQDHVSRVHAKFSTTHHQNTTTITLRTRKNTAPPSSSLKTRDERIYKKLGKDFVGSTVEENSEKRFSRDKNTRRNPSFRKRRDVGSGNSSFKSKDENIGIKSSKTVDNEVVNEKKLNKRSNERGHYNKVRGKNMSKESTKNDSSEVPLRLQLDMCSKRGDVMGAIQLYDKALKERIKLGQYHYNVLLYLCSSAAVGVVKPAKSGSGSRTLDTLGMSNEVSTVNSMELGELSDGDNVSYGVTELKNSGPNYVQSVDSSSSSSALSEKDSLTQTSNGPMNPNSQLLDDDQSPEKGRSSGNQDDHEIRLSEDAKKYALQRGFEIYERMCLDKVPLNEASLTAVGRMAMSMGNGDMAFDVVKKMKPLGINPRLRSYGPALTVFCSNGNVDKAFAVEKHMLEHGVYPEEPELEALLRVSVAAGKGDKVYYLLHKLRTSVRKVSPSTADIIVQWFENKEAARLGKTKWDRRSLKETMHSKGGGWHGQGWLGKGKWNVSRTAIRADAVCECCGEKLAMIDLDPIETESFAESVVSIAAKRERNSSFQKFQKWLDYYGPFEAVVDAANVGLFSQRKFKPSRVNAIVNGIRQMIPSKKWPLIVLHNKRITGPKMDQPVNRALIEKWKNADALYATPTGSNDDWYWLYAAIKFKCLIVTNDEMRDHTFQLLGNDFFPKWKERHQVRFSFSETGPEFYMPPSYSVVIQESENGSWHIPIASEHDHEAERMWLCITRANLYLTRQSLATCSKDVKPYDPKKQEARSTTPKEVKTKSHLSNDRTSGNTEKPTQNVYESLRNILSVSTLSNHRTILSKIEAAEKLGECVIDFQI
ncbi:hypothetical protein Pint_13201 [Pistacia integerrima]|uniref:Uncharacterized protein n=1 Tax=Pistacia integerrima TaxID=434235 RepID=A0ACC0Y7F4_9ROSI|nr:hypothetical protein Pint_13201 [Pistacia integerrima]